MSDQKQQSSELSPRSQQKRAAIMGGALALFLEKGFLGASVDDIADRAAVSKQTVYTHFGDKENLFSEVVIDTISRFGQPFFTEVEALDQVTDITSVLKEVAHSLLKTVLQPDVIRLRRLVISEAPRFPDLGRHYSQEGPDRGNKVLASLFDKLSAQNLLQVSNGSIAAQQFTWLIVSEPINRIMLLGDTARPSEEEIHALVEEGVATFVKAFS